MRNSDATQKQVVGLLAFGTSSSLRNGGSCSQRGNQSLSHSRYNLLPHRNSVRGGSIDRVPPDATITTNVHRLQRDLQLIAFLEEVTRDDLCHSHIATSLLQIHIRAAVLQCRGRGPNRERLYMAQRSRNLIR